MKVRIESAGEMQKLGSTVAEYLLENKNLGAVVVLVGDLGAGKTTFAQGFGAAFGIAKITSPTFVIARTYRVKDFDFNHVDAYRLTSLYELDDLDLDFSDSVSLVEWGLDYLPLLGDQVLLASIEFLETDADRNVEFEAKSSYWEEFLARMPV